MRTFVGHSEADVDLFRLDELTPYALADFAHRTGIAPTWLARELKRMSALALRDAQHVAESATYIGDEQAVVSKIADLVRSQPGAPKIDQKISMLRSRSVSSFCVECSFGTSLTQ